MRKVMTCLATAMILTGCGTADDRLAQFVAQANQQQSEQNQAMARVSQQAAEVTRQAFLSEKESREKLLILHQDLQTQRGQLEASRRELHLEQKQIAETQRWESTLGPVLTTLGMLLVSSLPLMLCWKLLTGLSRDPQEDRISAILIEELTTEKGPLALAAPPPVIGLPHGENASGATAT